MPVLGVPLYICKIERFRGAHISLFFSRISVLMASRQCYKILPGIRITLGNTGRFAHGQIIPDDLSLQGLLIRIHDLTGDSNSRKGPGSFRQLCCINITGATTFRRRGNISIPAACFLFCSGIIGQVTISCYLEPPVVIGAVYFLANIYRLAPFSPGGLVFTSGHKNIKSAKPVMPFRAEIQCPAIWMEER